jgi:DNA-binding CsgD family transcriptional regulator
MFAAAPPKRAELPEWRIPPNGAFASSWTVWSLMWAVPVGMRRASCSPVLMSAVMMLRSSPYSLSDARSTASPGVAKRMTGATGLYYRAGASWDTARARQRLRALGVRRRLAGMVPPRNGWPGLSECELEVARQVARGLTNRQVAERLFLSQHTVSNHLRHAFAKLDITSRVELARLAAIHDNTAE